MNKYEIECRKLAQSFLLKEQHINHIQEMYNVPADQIMSDIDYNKRLFSEDILGY